MKVAGKSIVVTGGTDGIGAASALLFCEHGANVIIIGRSAEKGNALLEKARNLEGTMNFVQADLSSMKTAKKAAQDVVEITSNVDVLLHCIGILIVHTEHTKEGIERDFAISYLSRFVFTEQLFSQRAFKPSTVMINVSAAEPKVPSMMQLEYDNLEEVKSRVGMKSHAQAQLGNDLYTVLASERYSIRTIGYGPGVVKTSVFRELPRMLVWFGSIIFAFSTRTPEEVAKQFLSILSNSGEDEPSVSFYNKKGSFPIAEFVDNGQRQKDLLNASLALAEEVLSTNQE